MKKLNNSEIKETELNILIAFDKYCRENNLTYFLCGGTLLGAIRHQGFIPWDDDIDVFMPRPDYEKFIALTEKEGISDNYETALYNKDSVFTPTPFAKIFDKNTLVEQQFITVPVKVWIDVFAIDGLPDDDKKINKIYKSLFFDKTLLGILTSDFSYKQKFYKKILKSILKPIVSLYGVKRLCKRIDTRCRKYNYNNSKIVGVSHWGYGPQEAMLKSELKPIEHVFEGHMFFIPANYNSYLTQLYHDYMTLPPEDKRIAHGLTAFLIDKKEGE